MLNDEIDGCFYTTTNKTQKGIFNNLIKDLNNSNINSLKNISRAEVQAKTGSLKNTGGHYSPLSGSLHPGLLVRGLKKIAEKKVSAIAGPLFHRSDIGTDVVIQKRINHMNSLR